MRYFMILLAAALLVAACSRAPVAKTDSGVPNAPTDIKEISPTEAQAATSKAYSQFIDVRTPEEYSGGHAARAVNIPLDTISANLNIPLDTISANLDRLEKNEPVYLICESGRRSQLAAQTLKKAGFNNVLNVAGGTAAWRAANLPIENQPPHANRAPVRQ
jgi:rhodanese-related sulfurtransferase